MLSHPIMACTVTLLATRSRYQAAVFRESWCLVIHGHTFHGMIGNPCCAAETALQGNHALSDSQNLVF